MTSSRSPSKLMSAFVALLLIALPFAGRSQQAQSPDPNAWVGVAQQAVQLIDSGRAGELWDNGSSEMKVRVSRNDFLAALKKSRTGEAVVSREWLSVERTQLNASPSVPAGVYANVRFQAVIGKRPVTELVTFRQESNGGWRWMGYLIK